MSLRNSQKRAWYIVFLSALIGCSLSATFPQFSMTVLEISKKTGLGEAFLLSGDTIKSATIVLAMLCSGFFYKKIGGWKTVLIGLTSLYYRSTVLIAIHPISFCIYIVQSTARLFFNHVSSFPVNNNGSNKRGTIWHCNSSI